MGLGIDPKVDVAFKKVFGSEDNALLLIDLLRALIHPPGSITGVEFLSTHSRKDALLDKQAVGDVRVREAILSKFSSNRRMARRPSRSHRWCEH